MFENTLIVITLTAIVMLTLFTIYSKIAAVNKDVPSIVNLRILSILRQELIKSFKSALELRKADENGFDSVADFVIDMVYEFVQDSNAFSEEEKQILTWDLLDSLLTPHLEALWEYKLEMPQKNMSRDTLEKLRATK